MAKRKILKKALDLLKKKQTQKEYIITPITITGSKETGGVITGTSKDIITPSTTTQTTPYIKKGSSKGSQLLISLPQSRATNTPVFVITQQSAKLVNPKQIQQYNASKNRLIRPLRPIKTIKNIGERVKLLQRLEETQQRLQTKKLRSLGYDKKYLNRLATEGALFGVSFATETLSGIKGIWNLPKNVTKAIPKIPKATITLVKDRKNIIPIAKLRFKSFKDSQGYLLKTSPSSYLGKVGANIFLFKASGKGLKIAGKVSKPATSKIGQYLPKFTKKSKVYFTGTQVQKGNKIFSLISFRSGKKIRGFAVGVGTIGKGGKLVLSKVVGKAFKLKSFPYLRKQPLDVKKVFTFASADIGKTAVRNGVQTFYLKKGVTIQKAVKNLIQVNIGRTAQVQNKKFFMNTWNGVRLQKVKVKGISLRNFFAKSQIFNKKDWSLIIGQARTNRKEIINYLGTIKTLKGGSSGVVGGTKVLRIIGKQNLVNIASALSTGQVGARKILSKLSPMARKVITNNIKAGLVLIPKIDFNKLKGISSVSAQSFTTSLSGLETPTTSGGSSSLGARTRQVPRHIDYFSPITGVISPSATKNVSRSKTIPQQQEKLIEVLKTPTAQREIQRLTPRQATRLRSALRQYLKFYPKMRTPIIKIIPFGFVSSSKSKVKRATNYTNLKTGWVVYGLSKGVYTRLSKKPLSKIDALSRGAYAIDRTTARTFKIVPVPDIKNFGRLIKREKGYYTQTKQKFREYRIKRGTKYYLQYKLIEKKQYGIDTRGEMKGLSLYRYLAKLKKQGKY